MNLPYRRRQRDWTDLTADPQAPFYFGRLLGANEMAVALLQQAGESENAHHIAEVLARMTMFFFTTGPADEQVTVIKAPLQPGRP
jgi:hypothetical protein